MSGQRSIIFAAKLAAQRREEELLAAQNQEHGGSTTPAPTTTPRPATVPAAATASLSLEELAAAVERRRLRREAAGHPGQPTEAADPELRGSNPTPASGHGNPLANGPTTAYRGEGERPATNGPASSQGQPGTATSAGNGNLIPPMGGAGPTLPTTPHGASRADGPAPVVPALIVGHSMESEGDDEGDAIDPRVGQGISSQAAFLHGRVSAAQGRKDDPTPVPSRQESPAADAARDNNPVPDLSPASRETVHDSVLVPLHGGSGLENADPQGAGRCLAVLAELRVERATVRKHPVGVIRDYFSGMELPDDLLEVELYESTVEIVPEESATGFFSTLDSPVSRMGGKSVLKDQLTDWFPDCHTYVEPFMGSVQVLLHKRRKDKIEIINDYDGDLVSFFRWVQHAPDALADMINSTPKSEALVLGFRADLKDRKLTGMARAVAWYFHNCASMNATGRENYASSPFTTWSPRIDKRHLQQVAARLRDVEIRNTSYRRIIESANKPVEGKVLFYMDPPYDETAGYETMADGKTTFGWAEQQDVYSLCCEIHAIGNYFLQTNSYTERLHRLYSQQPGFYLNERMVRYSVAATEASRGDKKEIIISNFPLVSRSRPKMF